jgi:hypothetical protein
LEDPVRLDLDACALHDALAACLAYCGERGRREPSAGDVADVLRSTALREPALRCLPPAYRPNAPPKASRKHERPMRESFAELLALRRRPVSNEAMFRSSVVQQELARPRALVAADWGCSDWDDAAKAASNDYLDSKDLPPWDTWLALADNPWVADGHLVIVCWVPPWATQLVQEGMNVLVLDNLAWVERRPGGYFVRP